MGLGDITIKVFDTTPQDGKSILLSNQRKATSGLQFVAECIQRFFRHIAGTSDASTIGVFLEKGNTKTHIFTRKDISTLLRAAGISDTQGLSRAQIRYLIGNIWREAGQDHSISKKRIQQLYKSASMHGPHGQMIHSLGKTKNTSLLSDLGEQLDLTESDLQELCQVSNEYITAPSQRLSLPTILTKAQENECKKIAHPSRQHGHSTQSLYEVNIHFLQKTLQESGLTEKDLRQKLEKSSLNQKKKEIIQSLLTLVTFKRDSSLEPQSQLPLEPQQHPKKPTAPPSPLPLLGRTVIHVPSITLPPPLPTPAPHQPQSSPAPTPSLQPSPHEPSVSLPLPPPLSPPRAHMPSPGSLPPLHPLSSPSPTPTIHEPSAPTIAPTLTLDNIEELSKQLQLMPRRKTTISAENVSEFLDRLVDLNITSLKIATLPTESSPLLDELATRYNEKMREKIQSALSGFGLKLPEGEGDLTDVPHFLQKVAKRNSYGIIPSTIRPDRGFRRLMDDYNKTANHEREEWFKTREHRQLLGALPRIQKISKKGIIKTLPFKPEARPFAHGGMKDIYRIHLYREAKELSGTVEKVKIVAVPQPFKPEEEERSAHALRVRDIDNEVKWSQRLQDLPNVRALKVFSVSGELPAILSQGGLEEFCDGGDMSHYLDTQRASPKQKMQLALEIAETLQGIHEADIVHGDLKFENILVKREEGVPHIRLSDFGTMRNIGEKGRDVSTYFPPERLFPPLATRADPAWDLWVLADMLNVLKNGTSPLSQMRSNKKKEFEKVAQRAGGGSHPHDEVDLIIKRLFSMNPADRPQASEVVPVLQAWLESQ